MPNYPPPLGLLSYISHIRHVPSQRVWSVLLTGTGLTHFGLEIGYGFQGNQGRIWTYLSFQFQVNKQERVLCVCWCSWHNFLEARSENWCGFWRQGLKTGVEKDIFWSREPGGTPSPKIPRSSPGPNCWTSLCKTNSNKKLFLQDLVQVLSLVSANFNRYFPLAQFSYNYSNWSVTG